MISNPSQTIAAPQQYRLPGNKAIWVGILAELTEFAVMFLVYFIARAHYPELFVTGPDKLSTVAGLSITLLMVTSGFFVAQAIQAIRANRVNRSFYWLLGAFFLGLGYPVVKYFEVRWNISQGLIGSGDVFQMSYYYLTFNHLVHVSWGLGGLFWVLIRTKTGAYSPEEYSGMEAFAVYWHATDLIWLIIFSLFYVL